MLVITASSIPSSSRPRASVLHGLIPLSTYRRPVITSYATSASNNARHRSESELYSNRIPLFRTSRVSSYLKEHCGEHACTNGQRAKWTDLANEALFRGEKARPPRAAVNSIKNSNEARVKTPSWHGMKVYRGVVRRAGLVLCRRSSLSDEKAPFLKKL